MPSTSLLPSWTRRHWLGAATAGAAALAGSGCARRDDEAVRFWAMGREGEVVTELLQDFQREEPGVPLRIEQLPWSAAHEKLLTAFAGDATPDLAQMGNTWLPEFVALGALEPLDALAQPAQAWTAPTTSRASGTPTWWAASSTGCPGTWTRACCSTGATCCNRPATANPRAPGASGSRC
jgi:ABC-type glycerol-3-phosphate transport system substrate-binding protein